MAELRDRSGPTVPARGRTTDPTPGPTTGEVAVVARLVEEAVGTDGTDAYLATLEELSSLLLEDASLEDLLAQVLELTSRALGASAAVSVTVVGDDGGYTTVAASHDEAVSVDAIQYELGEGPCIDSLETGREHLLCDLRADGPWSRFRDGAAESGFLSMMSLPLLAGGATVGALNVFATEVDAFGEDDVDLARRIAAPAAATVANARAYRRVTRLTAQLQDAMASRAFIEQAKGVLVAQRRCDPDTAFEVLREQSQRSNRKLRDLARMVVEHAVGQARPDRAADGRSDTEPSVQV